MLDRAHCLPPRARVSALRANCSRRQHLLLTIHATAIGWIALDQVPRHVPGKIALHPAPVNRSRPAATTIAVRVRSIALAACVPPFRSAAAIMPSALARQVGQRS